MGILKKVKGWFTAKSKAVEPSNTSLLYDLYGERAEYEYLNTKMKELEDVINNFQPPTVDLSNLADVSKENTFTQNNTFEKNITIPNHPTTNTQATNKHYVDTNLQTLNTDLNLYQHSAY